jgi:hypothetical protein
MCQKEMIPDIEPKYWDDQCLECNITYLSKELLQQYELLPGQFDKRTRQLIQQYNLLPETDYYWFREHQRFYTVSEMERIAKLKAFL